MIAYFYRGRIERGARRIWQDGYSPDTQEGRTLYPWQTKRECRDEAKLDGKTAVFFRDGIQEGKGKV